METVDSIEELLPLPVIVAQSVQRLIDEGEEDLPLQVVLIAIAKEATLESANVYQAGNTVFLGHTSPDKRRMFGRAFNMDTPKNFLNNGLNYFKYISGIGVRDYYTQFTNPSFVSAFKYMEKSPIGDQLEVDAYRDEEEPDQIVVHVKINDKIEVQ